MSLKELNRVKVLYVNPVGVEEGSLLDLLFLQ